MRKWMSSRRRGRRGVLIKGSKRERDLPNETERGTRGRRESTLEGRRERKRALYCHRVKKANENELVQLKMKVVKDREPGVYLIFEVVANRGEHRARLAHTLLHPIHLLSLIRSDLLHLRANKSRSLHEKHQLLRQRESR